MRPEHYKFALRIGGALVLKYMHSKYIYPTWQKASHDNSDLFTYNLNDAHLKPLSIYNLYSYEHIRLLGPQAIYDDPRVKMPQKRLFDDIDI